MTNFSDLTVTAPKKANVLFPVLDPNEALAADKNKKYTLSELFSAEPVASLAAAETLRSTNLLITNQWYKIANAPGTGDSLYLRAIENNRFAVSGVGLFNVPDFQNAGTYTGVIAVTTIAAGTRLGIWTPTIDGTITTGQIVIWNGFHYQCTNAANVNGSNPYIRTTAYTLLPKSAANVGYIVDYDEIDFDFATSALLKRSDKRGNVVMNRTSVYPSVSTDYSFQFGNDDVTSNFVSAISETHIANYVGQFYSNHLIRGLVKLNNLQPGEFSSNVLSLNLLEFVSEAGDFMNNVILTPSGSFDNIPLSEGFTGCHKDELSSTFAMALDLTTYSGGTDIGSISGGLSRLIGKWTLTGANASTLDSMNSAYLSCTHPIEFIVEAGNNQIFSPQAIGGAPSFYSFIGSAGNKTIYGRANGGDNIKVRVNGNYFEIYQVNNIA